MPGPFDQLIRYTDDVLTLAGQKASQYVSTCIAPGDRDANLEHVVVIYRFLLHVAKAAGAGCTWPYKEGKWGNACWQDMFDPGKSCVDEGTCLTSQERHAVIVLTVAAPGRSGTCVC